MKLTLNTYRYDVATQAMRGISALYNGAELGVAHTSLTAGGAHGAGANADLDDVRPGQDQLLHHLPGHHVTRLQQTQHG